MKFELYTLIDITRTDARRGDNPSAYKKQQNYLTVLNTIGLRANPTINKHPQITKDYPMFGTAYKNQQTVWKLDFDVEFEAATSVDMMKDDFDLIPIITSLDETAIIKDDVFLTRDKQYCNIVFVQIE